MSNTIQPANIFQSFMQGRQLAQQDALQRLKMTQMQQAAPFEQQLRELELERARQKVDIGQLQMEQQQDLAPLNKQIIEADLAEKQSLINRNMVGLTANQQEFASLTKGMSGEDIKKARRIKLGLDPRAVGSAIQTITQLGTANEVGATESEIASAKEEGKLIAKLKLEPELERKVKNVIASVKADADAMGKDRDNNASFNLYQTAFSGLAASLGQTATGPAFGLLPALTSKQQIADGAVAAVAPILKQMFRTAGEGTFTDQDQKLLMQMVPTRSDTPEARGSKMQNIDAIVRAKFNQPLLPASDQPQTVAPQQAKDPAPDRNRFQRRRKADAAFDQDLLQFMTPEEKALFE